MSNISGRRRCPNKSLRQQADQPIDLLFGVVKVRRDAQASFAHRDFGLMFFSQLQPDFFRFLLWRIEGDDSAPLPKSPRADDGIAFACQAVDQAISEHLQSIEDV